MKKQRAYTTGQTIGQVTIVGIEKGGAPQYRATYICQCQCGKTIKLRVTSLKERKNQSCGCLANANWRGIGEVSGSYFYTLNENARRRNIPVSVTLEHISDLLVQQKGLCALSGVAIGFPRGSKPSASLDRIDSSKGYEPGNVWWVHKAVNLMKGTLSVTELRDWCRLIAR